MTHQILCIDKKIAPNVDDVVSKINDTRSRYTSSVIMLKIIWTEETNDIYCIVRTGIIPMTDIDDASDRTVW